jgi:NADPH-dependent 2,4-dienoyl-CoA reductase/sulfur reductase-like enzyme
LQGRDAVVVGGGFIGVEVAASLRAVGLDVTLLHRGTGLFELLSAPALERDLVTLFQENDVDVVLLNEVTEFGGRSRVDSVSVLEGDTVPADLVVVGIGVDPVVDFLTDTGIAIDDGIVVNERFETNVEGVYAVGDVAKFRDPVFDSHRRIEHWSNANYQGTQVGKVLAGADAKYDAVSTFFTEFFGVTIKVFGDLGAQQELVLRGSLDERDLLGFYLSGDRLVATVTIDQSDDVEDRLKELLQGRARAHDVDALADPRLELTDAFTVA